jgi:hypothetical protein
LNPLIYIDWRFHITKSFLSRLARTDRVPVEARKCARLLENFLDEYLRANFEEGY